MYEKAEQHTQGSLPPAEGAPSPLFRERALMPLMNTPFLPGRCQESIEEMPDGPAKEIARAEGMLSNEKFVSKAPEAKVQEEREKLETYRQMMEQVQERLESLKAKRS